MSKATQCQRILSYMDDYGSITPIDALKDLGVMRLAARIKELKKAGVLIADEMVTDRNRYGERIHYKRYRKVS